VCRRHNSFHPVVPGLVWRLDDTRIRRGQTQVTVKMFPRSTRVTKVLAEKIGSRPSPGVFWSRRVAWAHPRADHRVPPQNSSRYGCSKLISRSSRAVFVERNIYKSQARAIQGEKGWSMGETFAVSILAGRPPASQRSAPPRRPLAFICSRVATDGLPRVDISRHVQPPPIGAQARARAAGCSSLFSKVCWAMAAKLARQQQEAA